jgi:hypothetical protein
MARSFLEQFKKEHGNCVQVGDNLLIYEDGFQLRGSSSRGGLFQIIEPEDELAALRGRRDYTAALLEKEEKDWHAFKSECEQQAQLHLQNPSFCPSAPHDAVEQLEAGKARIEKLRADLAKIEEQLPDNKVNQHQEERSQQRYSDALQHRNQISAVEL